jgi:GNAT superfamily N-acetyltransferase
VSRVSIRIRPAIETDVPTILALIRELAAYERALESVRTTEADLLRDGFGAQPAFHTLLVEVDGAVVGFALYFFKWSTWEGRRVLHLEDLFVRPSARKLGAGMAIMRALAKETLAQNGTRFEWQVLDWNEPAFKFYEQLGSRILKDWVSVRLDGEDLEALAEGASED